MKTYPLVSLIMPVRNEGPFIEKSLLAVLEQDYPKDQMEIIVSDGMSTDETRAIVGKFQETYTHLRLVDNPKQIVAPGLNEAICQAKGEIIIRIDGHCEIALDYVRKCVEHLQRDSVDGVGGPIDTVGEDFVSEAIALGMSSWFGVGGSAFRTIKDKKMLAETIPFPAYTKQIIEKAGPYDEELVRNQDDEYNYRISKLGGKLLLCPDIRSRYYGRSSLLKLWKQYFQYGYWKVRVMQKHPKQMRVRQFMPAIFVAALTILAFIAPLSPFFLRFFFALMGVYLIANLSASLWGAFRKKWVYAFLLPFIYGILHISYGVGFLTGLLRFWDRWKQ